MTRGGPAAGDEEAGEGGKREGERQDLERKDAYPSQQSGLGMLHRSDLRVT